MATKSLMVQLYVEQEFDALVQIVYGLHEEAFLFLDPSKDIIVREIASEKLGGILVSKMDGACTIGIPSNPFTQVTLIAARGGDETVLYAPTHVPSPPFSGMALAILEISEVGAAVDAGADLSLFRAVGAHLYVDQIDP